MLLKRHVEFNQTVLIINFLSLNFTSIEIEGERVSCSQNERALGGGRGGGCQNSGILSERPFECPLLNQKIELKRFK